jgi:hypothetical protein
MNEHTKEAQYQDLVELRKLSGLTTFGLMSNDVWEGDPKRICFALARYKFVPKMFSGMNRVLEVGCADTFGTRLVQQEVSNVVAVEFDQFSVEDVNASMGLRWSLN